MLETFPKLENNLRRSQKLKKKSVVIWFCLSYQYSSWDERHSLFYHKCSPTRTWRELESEESSKNDKIRCFCLQLLFLSIFLALEVTIVIQGAQRVYPLHTIAFLWGITRLPLERARCVESNIIQCLGSHKLSRELEKTLPSAHVIWIWFESAVQRWFVVYHLGALDATLFGLGMSGQGDDGDCLRHSGTWSVMHSDPVSSIGLTLIWNNLIGDMKGRSGGHPKQ